MLMRDVAQSFQVLGSTTGRYEMTELLADLFRRAPKEDIHRLIYLLHGKLGPAFAAPNFGVNERLIVWALASATGSSIAEIDRLFKVKGDLGLVGQELLPEAGGALDLRGAHDALRQVAESAGSGSQERKVALVGDLIKRSGGLEAKYILRMLQGRLRLGVGDATIMDALSEAAVGDYSLRPRIERAYSLCSDLGLVGRTLFLQGPEALDQFGPHINDPIMAELAERLSSSGEIVRKLGRVEAEPKYDGLRLQLHKDGQQVRFFTRRLEDVTGMFPELARAAVLQIAAERAILDGEAVVYNPESGEYLPFQVTARRRRKHCIEEMETRYPLRYFAFDLLYADGRDLTRETLLDRRQELAKLLRWSVDDPLQITESILTDDPAELDRFFQDKVQRGLEGILAKRPDSTYQAGQRNFNWVKLKRAYQGELRDTVDVVLIGYLAGKGKRAQFGIGSLLAAVYDPTQDRFRTVTRIGSGLTEAQWAEMKRRLDEVRSPDRPARVDSLIRPDAWAEPVHVVEVLADEITRSPLHTCGKADAEPGYALRFPRIVSLRPDKSPEDATTEQEILALYGMQQAGAKKAAGQGKQEKSTAA